MVESHEPESESDVQLRAYVNGTRIPVGEGEIHLRREGPCAVTSYANIEFVSPYEGIDYVDVFDTIETATDNPNTPVEEREYDSLRLEVRDYTSRFFSTVFHGLVTGVSNTSGQSRVWDVRAQGIGHFLTHLPASKTFGRLNGADAGVILNYLREETNAVAPSTFTVTAPTDQTTNISPTGELLSSVAELLIEEVGVSDALNQIDELEDVFRVLTPKEFKANRHTLADVIEWFENKTDTRVWFVPTNEGAELVALPQPRLHEHRAHYLGGETQIVNNDAYAELRPINTLVGKGTARQSIEHTPRSFQSPNPATEQYVNVTARHVGLYQRAGNVELHADTHLETDAVSKTEVEAETKRELARAIEETTGGTMTTMVRAPIVPYDTIEAQPTCNAENATTTEPITYAIDRVKYVLRSNEPSTCELNVGINADPEEDITVVESSWEPV